MTDGDGKEEEEVALVYHSLAHSLLLTSLDTFLLSFCFLPSRA